MIIMSYCYIVHIRSGLSSLGISGNKSGDKSSLQDQDKHQISFFVECFPMKYIF